MINWYSIIFSALWIFGVGFVTAGLSLGSYLANQQEQPLKKMLEKLPCKLMIDLGLTLFCLGWTGLAGGWERIIWGILTVFFLVRTWQNRKLRYT